MSVPPLELLLFTTDVETAVRAEAAGIDGIVVDWERRGKQRRQEHYDTEVNVDTPADVVRLASHLTLPITVRINPLNEDTASEIHTALENGASVIMLPMARCPEEVAHFVSLVDGQARTIVQIETQQLVDQCAALREISWDSAYIGLNDLMISRGGTSLWDAFADGTVDHIFDVLDQRPVGVAGVTVIGGGTPIPFTELLQEMARLGCRMSFLRRTFKREILGRDVAAEVSAIRAAWKAARKRSAEAVRQDHAQFRERFLSDPLMSLVE